MTEVFSQALGLLCVPVICSEPAIWYLVSAMGFSVCGAQDIESGGLADVDDWTAVPAIVRYNSGGSSKEWDPVCLDNCFAGEKGKKKLTDTGF